MVSAVEGWNRSSLQITVIKVINLKRGEVLGSYGMLSSTFLKALGGPSCRDDITSEKQHGETGQGCVHS